MATIALNTTLTATHLNRTFRASVQITQAVERAWSYTQVIGFAAAEAISVGGDISTLGVAWFTNKDDTNYVEIGPDSGGTMIPAIQLKPGESYPVRLVPGVTYKAQADTAAVDLDITVFND